MNRIDGVGLAVVPYPLRRQRDELPLLPWNVATGYVGVEQAQRFRSFGWGLVAADAAVFEAGLQIGQTRVDVKPVYRTEQGRIVTIGSHVYVRMRQGHSLPAIDGLSDVGPVRYAEQFIEGVVEPRVDVLQVLEALRRDQRVDYVEAGIAGTVTHRQDLPAEAVNVWPLERMHAGAAWEVTRGESVRVAVIDTGFFAGHVDLQSQIDAAAAAFVSDGNGAAPVITVGSLPALEQQDTSHGTHCAALVGGALNDRHGCGIAPAATIIPIAVDAQLSQAGLSRAIAYAVDPTTAVEQPQIVGCDVISCSLGFDIPGVDQMLAAALAFAEQRGVPVCWAVPNEVGPTDPICQHSTVMGIGATQHDGSRRPGATGKGLFCVAPGDKVKSAVPHGHLFEPMSGTSVATPLVAGICALVKSAARKANLELSATQVRAIIERACETTPSRADFGHGRLDAGAAVKEVLAALT